MIARIHVQSRRLLTVQSGETKTCRPKFVHHRLISYANSGKVPPELKRSIVSCIRLPTGKRGQGLEFAANTSGDRFNKTIPTSVDRPLRQLVILIFCSLNSGVTVNAEALAQDLSQQVTQSLARFNKRDNVKHSAHGYRQGEARIWSFTWSLYSREHEW